MSEANGITLVALVITIIILLILAGITLMALTGDNGLFARAKEAKEKTQKGAATEKINLVIADVYTKSYAENLEEPTLQDLADGFCEDEETEYVDIATRKTSAIDKIEVGTNEAIYVKLKKYPYEFKINGTLKIAEIDGKEYSETTGNTGNPSDSGNSGNGENGGNTGDTGNNGSSVNIDKEEYENLKSTVASLTGTVTNLSTDVNNLKNENANLKTDLNNFEKNIQSGKFTRVTLYDGNEAFNTPTEWTTINTNITVRDISPYIFLEFQVDAVPASGGGNSSFNTIILAKDQITYRNSNTESWSDGSIFNLSPSGAYFNAGLCCWFKNSTTLHIGFGSCDAGDISQMHIRKISGIL